MIETKKFILGGNATFTVTSKRTGARFTFKVRKPSAEKPHFVSLLNGSDNESDYQFFGTIFNQEAFRHSKNSRITAEAPSAKAFAFLWHHIDNAPIKLPSGEIVPPMSLLEVHHEGKCCCCGRKLTVPESIESGIGPECAKKMG